MNIEKETKIVEIDSIEGIPHKHIDSVGYAAEIYLPNKNKILATFFEKVKNIKLPDTIYMRKRYIRNHLELLPHYRKWYDSCGLKPYWNVCFDFFEVL